MDLSVDKTGARPGDVLVGYRCTGTGIVVKVVDPVYPIRERVLEAVAEPGWLARLGSIEFFAAMPEEARREYLVRVSLEKHVDMADQRVDAELIDPGSLVSTCGADPEAVAALVGRVVSLEVLRDLVPGKADTAESSGRSLRALHHTLAFLPQFYRIQTLPTFVTGYTGLVVDGTEAVGLIRHMTTAKRCIVLRGFRGLEPSLASVLAYPVEQEPAGTNPTDVYMEAFRHRFGRDPVPTLPGVPSFLKSVLQKIIRVRPVEVEARGVRYPAAMYLCSVFTQLLTHPGSFVPDIQRFVTGQESAIKRLVVSCLEDSYGDSGALLLALVMAAATQRSREYHPNRDEYEMLLDLCEDVLECPDLFHWDLDGSYERCELSDTSTDLENLSAILDDLRSFETDLQMVRSIAHRDRLTDSVIRVVELVGLVGSPPARVQVMPVWHAVDQHCMPEVVYHMCREVVAEYVVPGSCPFNELFRQIFRQVTGVNGRCGARYPQNPKLVEEVVRVQKVLYESSVPAGPTSKGKEPETVYTGETEELEVELSVADLAGAIGVVDVYVRGVGNCMVTMHPEDPNRLIAVRRPTRNIRAEDCALGPEAEAQVLLEAYRRICRGVRLVSPGTHLHGLMMVCMAGRTSTVRNTANPNNNTSTTVITSGPIPFIRQLQFFQDKSSSKTVVSRRSWEQVRRHVYSFPLFSGCGDRPPNLGIHREADSLLLEGLTGFGQGEVRRALSHVCNRKRVEVPRVSRDGGGTRDVVRPEDVGAWQILRLVSQLYPSAITPDGPTSFQVHNLALLRCVADILRERVTSERVDYGPIWRVPGDQTTRVPRDYQYDSVEEMISSMPYKRGHFIWIPVGMGKTWILLEFFRRVLNPAPDGIHRCPQPLYIIYTLPRSAAASVIQEIEYFGMPINMMIPIKAKHPLRHLEKNREPLAGHINIIEHDHLKYAEETLLEVADRSIFVNDEVHKALNDSKRTSVCLELSRLCLRFVVLTGTPVVDNETYKLMWWLEQLVSFPVTDTNFWVAANAMTARRVDTGIAIDRQEVHVDLADPREVDREVYAEYRKLVSPELGGTNTRATEVHARKAFRLCWDVCEQRSVELVRDLLREGASGVMLVVRDAECQKRLRVMTVAALMEAALIETPAEVFMLTGSIVLTEDHNPAVDPVGGRVRVVIVPMSKSEGYTLTRCDSLVTSVYFGNQATRQQLDGRINRTSQRAAVLRYRTVHCGLLTHVLRNHNGAANINAVLQAMTR